MASWSTMLPKSLFFSTEKLTCFTIDKNSDAIHNVIDDVINDVIDNRIINLGSLE